MSDWQPIETAPRDGTDVLLSRAPKKLRGLQKTEDIPPVVAGWFCCGGECGWSSYDEPDKWVDGDPTHWTPLPAPPVRP